MIKTVQTILVGIILAALMLLGGFGFLKHMIIVILLGVCGLLLTEWIDDYLVQDED